MSSEFVTITVQTKGKTLELRAARGETLRQALLDEGCSPYQGYFRQFNCGGMGICGSCKVKQWENGEWWERRSCQIRCFQDLEIQVE